MVQRNKEVMKDEKLVIGFVEMVLDLKDKIAGIPFLIHSAKC